MVRSINPLAVWQRRALYGAGIALLLTGALWLIVHYSVGAGAGELPHPAEAWLMRLHGLAGFFALFVLGVLAALHIPRGWRVARHRRYRRQRSSGVALCVLGGLMALSAYLLYYFAPEGVRAALGWAHVAAGAAMGGVLAMHCKGNKVAPPPAGQP